jgi:hypothetical protein
MKHDRLGMLGLGCHGDTSSAAGPVAAAPFAEAPFAATMGRLVSRLGRRSAAISNSNT